MHIGITVDKPKTKFGAFINRIKFIIDNFKHRKDPCKTCLVSPACRPDLSSSVPCKELVNHNLYLLQMAKIKSVCLRTLSSSVLALVSAFCFVLVFLIILTIVAILH